MLTIFKIPSIPIKLYADDTNVFILGNNIDAITLDAKDCIHNLNEWFVANKLSLSIDKTCFSTFGVPDCEKKNSVENQ